MTVEDTLNTFFQHLASDDEMRRVFRCKYCNRPEYYGEFRWLSGKALCRSCYKAEYEDVNKTLYIWDDLDGERPKEDELHD